MKPGRVSLSGLVRLVKLLRGDPPDLIQTWLYHADILGSLAARWCGRPPVVWNIRHATLTPGIDSRSTLWAAKIGAWMSPWAPRAIVINTRAGREVHVAAGYDYSKLTLIPNGFDLERFRPSEEARASVRRDLGLPHETPLVGMIARYSRLKGQDVFIHGMQRVARSLPDVRFLMCGRDIDSSNTELAALIAESGFPNRFHLLGDRRDIPRLQAALDLAVCPSLSEAFSNSIGEALACGVPCVASNVGDSAQVIGTSGRIVPPGDPDALGRATTAFFRLPSEIRRMMSRDARQRIERDYDIHQVAWAYQDLWELVAGRKALDQRRLRRAA
jgi:glycosyltransferase involved in cell wall biosynthesis